MPEFPEVNTLINHLKKEDIFHQKIISIDVFYPTLLKNISQQDFAHKLINEQIIDINQRGKYIIICFTNNKYLLIHLRMEGKIFIFQKTIPKRLSQHLLAQLKLSNHLCIGYFDTRRFGTFHFFDCKNKLDTYFTNIQLGPDVLSKQFYEQYLYDQLQKQNVGIKTFLLNQHNVAGIGNIYADEILFDAKIFPLTKTKAITKIIAKQLYVSCQKIIQKAIDYQGTTVFSFAFAHNHTGQFQNFLQVYHRQNQSCYICHNKIKKIKVNGRSTHFCPFCQKELL